MSTITVRDLEAVCSRINRTVNGEDRGAYVREPVEAGTKPNVGHWNINAYTLSGAYGGYSLHRIVNESGGVTDVFGCGHVPKRDLYNRMQALLRGVDVSP